MFIFCCYMCEMQSLIKLMYLYVWTHSFERLKAKITCIFHKHDKWNECCCISSRWYILGKCYLYFHSQNLLVRWMKRWNVDSKLENCKQFPFPNKNGVRLKNFWYIYFSHSVRLSSFTWFGATLWSSFLSLERRFHAQCLKYSTEKNQFSQS